MKGKFENQESRRICMKNNNNIILDNATPEAEGF